MDKKQNEGYDLSDNDAFKFDYERFMMEEEAAEATKKPSSKKPKPAKASESKSSEVYDWIQSLVSALLICMLIFAFFVRSIEIIGSSMEPTFSNGDSVIISKILYEPKQGDVVVLRKLSFQEEPIIKRVIALAGQTVDIDFDEGIVYVDDQPLDEPYTADLTHLQLNFDGEITVPENCVFVMGDNRNDSLDSRYGPIGCVDERYIMGRVLLRLLPFDKFGTF